MPRLSIALACGLLLTLALRPILELMLSLRLPVSRIMRVAAIVPSPPFLLVAWENEAPCIL